MKIYIFFWSHKPSNPFEVGFSSSEEEAFDEDTDDFYDAMALYV